MGRAMKRRRERHYYVPINLVYTHTTAAADAAI